MGSSDGKEAVAELAGSCRGFDTVTCYIFT